MNDEAWPEDDDAHDLSDATEPTVRADGDDAHRLSLQRGQRLAELSNEQLWLRFFGVGGDIGLFEVEAYLAGLIPLPALQRDMLAHAVNERLDELLLTSRVPYSETAHAPPPTPGPELSALVDMLTAASTTPPDRLAALAANAGDALGVGVTLYLADHDQRLLVPATAGLPPHAGAHGRPALDIDSTLAGDAFRHLQTMVSDTGEHPRLWLPLLGGTERLGVVEVELTPAADINDGVLREQCQNLTNLIGCLVPTTGARGDGLDAVRRRRPRTPTAELIWQLLPPPTGGTDRFALSGWVEPADTVGGDAFDYAVSHAHVSLAVFDATGHGLPAALMAAAALSAYRSARRNGHGLLAQARAVDQTISSLGSNGAFVTGFLGEIDLTSGLLRYLSAGHPDALLLRSGKVMSTLTGGRRMPFGHGSLVSLDDPHPGSHDADRPLGDDLPAAPGDRPASVGEHHLQPGDWLVVHTDGVTEGRDTSGVSFGDARLVSLLEQASATGQAPPETARRLTHAVLEHQGGQLQDDATVLLGCWLGH